MLSGFLEDIRFALRLLLRRPVFTAVAVLLLALSIGASTAVFSLIYGVILKPLPYRDADRIFFVGVRDEARNRSGLNPNALEFQALEGKIRSAEAIGALLYQPFNLRINGRSYLVTAAFASPQFYDAIGVPLLMGRKFLPDEFQSGRNQAVFFSERFWKERLGGDPSIIGKTVQMENETHIVAGILASLKGEAPGPEAVVPLPLTRELLETVERRSMQVALRLKPGAAKEQAEEEVKAIYRRLAETVPQSSLNKVGYLVPAREWVHGKSGQPLAVLSAAVGLILLLACANLAGILLARAAERWREMAIRSALGASQLRIFRQMLTESILLSLIGGAAGFALAIWLLEAIKNWTGFRLPRMADAAVDFRAGLFSLLISILAGILFGTAPAWSVLRLNLVSALNEESRGSSGGASRSFLRSMLVASEVAVCAILLVSAGLLYRTYSNLAGAEMGFRPQGVLLLRTMLPEALFPDDAARAAFQRTALERLKSLPGVRGASIAAYPPLTNVEWPCQVRLIGGESAAADPFPAFYNTVSPGYFNTIAAHILSGRDFQDSDTPDSPRALIVSATFRDKYFGGRDPVGQTVSLLLYNKTYEAAIVGVVADIAFNRPDEVRRPMVYESFTQRPWAFPVFAVSTAGPPDTMIPTITRALSEIAPDVAVDQVAPLTARVDRVMAQHSLALFVFSIFAALAVLLSAVGLYGVVAISVTQRTREIGIRMALGASPAMIRLMVLRQGLLLAATGLLAGMVTAPLAGNALRSLLYGILPLDPLTFASVLLVILLISTFTALLPALRAGRLDPASALRQ